MPTRNTAAVRLRPTGHALAVTEIKLNLGAEDRAWQCSLGISSAADFALIAGRPADDPALLEIEINGYQWLIRVTDAGESRQGWQTDYNIEGFGASIALGREYAPLISYQQPATPLTPAAMAASFIPSDSGYTLDWSTELPNWPIPASTAAFNRLSPLEAIGWVADSIGAIVRPDDVAGVLHILPAQSAPRWRWEEQDWPAIQDYHIYSASRSWIGGTPDNAVIVAGDRAGGRVFNAVRDGTPGDVYADDWVHPLITHDDPARVIAERVLSDTGPRQTATLAVVLSNANGPSPLRLPGDGVAVPTLGLRDIVQQTTVTVSTDEAGAYEVEQDLVLGRQSLNSYLLFQQATRKDPVQIAQVTGELDAGVYRVRVYAADAVVTVSSVTKLTVGSWVKIRGDAVEAMGPANLPLAQLITF